MSATGSKINKRIVEGIFFNPSETVDVVVDYGEDPLNENANEEGVNPVFAKQQYMKLMNLAYTDALQKKVAKYLRHRDIKHCTAMFINDVFDKVMFRKMSLDDALDAEFRNYTQDE